MRNAIKIDATTFVTIDNAACIGEKEADVVYVPNEIAAYFTARTAILEQWCAGAMPIQLLLANFTSDTAWEEYVKGCERVFREIGQKMPPITGSSETNFAPLQSGLSLTMIGKQQFTPSKMQCRFFVIGKPLVGQQVIDQPENVANLAEIYSLLSTGVIQQVWPTGSKGIGAEIISFVGENFTCEIDLTHSAGPSAAVLVAVQEQNIDKLYSKVSAPITEVAPRNEM
ncbi:hypothetical protein [Solibacillus sp. CAU 1738]|uniref:hypothetical protein n=1 Tax=Solibacillus sp. CAU 1738 TaxID=3140363 RepID=UPI003261630E